MHKFKNSKLNFFECVGDNVLFIPKFVITTINHIFYNKNWCCSDLKNETHATPNILIINILYICRIEAHATPCIAVINIVQVSEDEKYETHYKTIANFI